ncbi:unnamed protein product, partial [marine sediment metagenome]
DEGVSPVIEELFGKIDFEKTVFKKIEIDTTQRDITACPKCKGSKTCYGSKVECECGAGEVEFEDDYGNVYVFECAQCDGKTFFIEKSDIKMKCFECEGSGFLYNLENILINKDICGFEYVTYFTKTFEDLKFSTQYHSGSIVPFIFKGGQGILMKKLHMKYNNKSFALSKFVD